MDQERQRIEADLRGLIEGEVRFDDVALQLYSTDASIYEVQPLGIVRPRGLDEVVATVRYAAENQIPIHPRGAGSGLAGESLGRGLIIDFAHEMRRIVSTGETTIRVQPGLTLVRLNEHLAPTGRFFAPDPANQVASTVGGTLSNDGSGSHWLLHGSARQHVESLQIVLADGEVIEASRHSLSATSGGSRPEEQLIRQLAPIIERQADIIERHRPQSAVNRAGYHVYDLISEGQFDLAKLLVGSEGTLGLITEATLRTVAVPNHTAVALLLFDRLDTASHAALEIVPLGATACDLLDRRLISLARENDPRFELLLPPETEAALLVETEGETELETHDRLRQIVDLVVRRRKMAFDSRTAQNDDDCKFFWHLVSDVVPSLYRLKGSMRPLPFVEDMAVPPSTLPDVLIDIQNVLKRHEVTASLFAHAGHGQIHVRPFLDLANPEHVAKMRPLAVDLFHAVLKVNGTVGGEHGSGLSRTWFLREQFGPLYDVFRQVKQVFDPENLLNPGKVVAYDPQLPTENLRPVTVAIRDEVERLQSPEPSDAPAGTGEMPQVIELMLDWDIEAMGQAARACNGCGRCRTVDTTERMCPIFRISPREEATPRAKANLMRAFVTGKLDPALLADDLVSDVSELCINCRQCRLECPANVDIPKLMIECKAQYVATNGLHGPDWYMMHIDRLSRMAQRRWRLANRAISNRFMRWLMEKTFGIAQGRKLPRLARRNFLRLAHRYRLTRPTRRDGAKVLYFLDTYATWYDVELAEAFVAVLEHNGVSVYVHPGQVQSGMAMISVGAIPQARRVARRNLACLTEAVRQGYTVVTTEPSAAVALTQDYPTLIDNEDAKLVAENTLEASTYLWQLHQRGNLALDLQPVNMAVAYHIPCHLRALEVGTPGAHLLGLIPGLKVQQLEKGCSGMAGTFGLMKKNYRSSLRAGWPLISAMRQPDVQIGATECAACKIQMEQGTTKPTIHPVKLLAYSYGCMPEIARLLSARGEDLFVT